MFKYKKIIIKIIVIILITLLINVKIIRIERYLSPNGQFCVVQYFSLSDEFINLLNSHQMSLPGDNNFNKRYGFYILYDDLNKNVICKIRYRISSVSWSNDTLYYFADSFDYNINRFVKLPRKAE